MSININNASIIPGLVHIVVTFTSAVPWSYVLRRIREWDIIFLYPSAWIDRRYHQKDQLFTSKLSRNLKAKLYN